MTVRGTPGRMIKSKRRSASPNPTNIGYVPLIMPYDPYEGVSPLYRDDFYKRIYIPKIKLPYQFRLILE